MQASNELNENIDGTLPKPVHFHTPSAAIGVPKECLVRTDDLERK